MACHSLGDLPLYSLFIGLRGNQRLGLLLRTFHELFVDFVHMLIFFSFIFISLVIAAHTLFGYEIAMFSTFGKSLHSSFLLLLGFMFSTYRERMVESGGALAVMWIALFNVIIVVIFCSLLLAMFLDIITRSREHMGKSQSLNTQVWRTLSEGMMHLKHLHSHRDRQAPRQKCSEYQILQALVSQEQPDQAENVTVSDLCNVLGDDSTAQKMHFQRLILDVKDYSHAAEEPVTLLDCMRVCHRADSNVQELCSNMHKVVARARQHEVESAAVKASNCDPHGDMKIEDADSDAEVTPQLPESPEPEPPTQGASFVFNEAAAQRLWQTAEAQSYRHAQLEGAVGKVAEQLEELLEGGAADVMVDPERLDRLQRKIRNLAAKLGPILDINAI